MEPGHLPRRDRPCSLLKRKPSVDPRTQLLYIVTFACLHFHFPWEKHIICKIGMKSKHIWPFSRIPIDSIIQKGNLKVASSHTSGCKSVLNPLYNRSMNVQLQGRFNLRSPK